MIFNGYKIYVCVSPSIPVVPILLSNKHLHTFSNITGGGQALLP